jgi:putative endonuclease
MNNVHYGKKGEDLAARHLKKAGCKILQRNFTCPFGEIDIIALDKGTIVFAEVKARRNVSEILPSQSVGALKRSRYRKAASYYIKINNLFGNKCRFDVIEICDEKINHIQNAF